MLKTAGYSANRMPRLSRRALMPSCLGSMEISLAEVVCRARIGQQ